MASNACVCTTTSYYINGHDEPLTYDVYITNQTVSCVGYLSPGGGDLHVYIDRNSDKSAISIYEEALGWLAWDPTQPTCVAVTDAMAYPTPCHEYGLKYVGSKAEQQNALAGDVLSTSVLALLIARNACSTEQFDMITRKREDSGNELSTSRTTRKRRATTAATLKGKRLRQSAAHKEKATHDADAVTDQNCDVDMSHHSVALSWSKKSGKQRERLDMSVPTNVNEDVDMDMCYNSPVSSTRKLEKQRDMVPSVNIDTDVEMGGAGEIWPNAATQGDSGDDRNLEFDMEEPENDYRRFLKDVSLPQKRTRRLSWHAHEVATYRPWTSKEDVEAAIFMSEAPKASTVKTLYPMLLELANDATHPTVMHPDIQEALAHGTAVFIRGWTPQHLVEFNTESIQAYRPPLSQRVQWQDAKKRAGISEMPVPSHHNFHSWGTLSELIDAARDKKACYSSVQLPVFTQEIPGFVKGILHDSMAMATTASESYTTNDGLLASNHPSSVVGPQLMHFDTWRSTSWDTFTHTGFLTYPQHDCNGFLTYSYVRTGAKLCCYLQLDIVDEVDRNNVQAKWDEYYKEPFSTPPKNVKAGTLLLQPGGVLIQPPGVNYMGYTPVPTIISGGHFLNYDTMHLTHMALDSDYGPREMRGRNTAESNAMHLAMLRKVFRMVIALPQVVGDRPRFRRRSIIAMAVIVHVDPLPVCENTEYPAPQPTDALFQEIHGEQMRAKWLMEKVMERWNITNPRMEIRQGMWRDPGPWVELTFLKAFLP